MGGGYNGVGWGKHFSKKTTRNNLLKKTNNTNTKQTKQKSGE